MVGYNLQAAVDTATHIIVAHEVINLSHDRTSLATMGEQARNATGADTLTVLADRGYFSGPQVLACKGTGVVPICPKPLTSGAKADGPGASRTSSTRQQATPIAARPARR